MIYIFLIVLLSVSILFDHVKKSQKNRIIPMVMLIVCYLLAIFAGIRYNVGLDYGGYEVIFDEVASIGDVLLGNGNYFDIHGELGFLLLNSLIKTIFNEYEIVLIVMAFLSAGIICCSSYLYSLAPFTSLFIYFNRYFLFRDMGQIRSALVGALCMFSIQYIEKQEFKKFLIIFAIAVSFHKIAIILLPVYFLGGFRIKTFQYFLLILFSLGITIILPIDKVFTWFLGEDSFWVRYAFSEEFTANLSLLNPVIILQLFILTVFLFFRKRLEEICFGYTTLLNMYALSTCMLIVFYKLSIVARLVTVLSTAEIFMIASFVFISDNRWIKLMVLVCILLFGSIFMYLNINKEGMYELFVPYRSLIG